jgi:hypothetical protein
MRTFYINNGEPGCDGVKVWFALHLKTIIRRYLPFLGQQINPTGSRNK